MRKGSIRPAYSRLFDPARRPAQFRASRVSAVVAIVEEEEEETEEQLADHYDSFNLYDVENPIVQDLDKGFGFSGNWVFKDDERQLYTDDFESYTPEDPVSSTLNGGTNWDSAFIIVNAT